MFTEVVRFIIGLIIIGILVSIVYIMGLEIIEYF